MRSLPRMLRNQTDDKPTGDGENRHPQSGLECAPNSSSLALKRLAQILARQAAREWAGKQPSSPTGEIR